MTEGLLVDQEALRAEVLDKYREVATSPSGSYHFHTERALANRLGYDVDALDSPPEEAELSTCTAMRSWPESPSEAPSCNRRRRASPGPAGQRGLRGARLPVQ